MLAARGELCLMVDADGATQFSDLGKLVEDIKRIEKNGQGVVVGSRSHLVTTEAVVKVSMAACVMVATQLLFFPPCNRDPLFETF